MNEHLSAQLILRYRTRSLAPAELLALDDHLSGCARCRASLGAWVEPFAPESVQAQLFVETTPAETLDGQAAPVSWWRKFWLFDVMYPAPLAWRVAGALALLAVLLWSVTRWRSLRDEQREIARQTPAVSSPTAAASVEIAPDTPANLLALKDGELTLTLDTQGNLRGAEALPAREQAALKTALTSGELETPRSLAELQSKGTALMGGNGTTEAAQLWANRSRQTLLQPFGVIVAEARPKFRWQALTGAARYQVIVSDPAANFREVAASGELTVTSWTPKQALPRDRVLRWQVIATLTNGEEVSAPAAEAAEAKFRLLSHSQFDELTRGQKQLVGQHLSLALLYARLGLVTAAERELRLVAQANPDAPVVKKMLRELRIK